MRELLRDQRAPDEAAAEERGWRVVGRHSPSASVRRARRPRAVVGLRRAALALLVAGLTPPGQAVADWLRDAVQPGREDAREALVSLPTRGRLLVTSQRGPWIVERDGSKRLLGAFDDASWSPRGLFVVVTRGHEVIALEPGGQPRWSLARPAGCAPRWSPDGFRIAYQAGTPCGSSRATAPGTAIGRGVAARRRRGDPGPAHRLAYADRAGRVNGRCRLRRGVLALAEGPAPTQLAWSFDGRLLLAVAPTELRLFELRAAAVDARHAARHIGRHCGLQPGQPRVRARHARAGG